MKVLCKILVLMCLSKVAFCQKASEIRKQNDFGFRIVNIEDKYSIADSLGNYVTKDTFDFITLESINSWGRKRNTFVCKKDNKSYLISFDCQNIMKFDSINITESGDYICISNNSYLLMNDEFLILHDSLTFLTPLRRMAGEFIYKKNDKCGVLDKEEVLIELTVDSLIDIYSWKYIGVISNGKMGIFDYDEEKIILEPNYDFIVTIYHPPWAK